MHLLLPHLHLCCCGPWFLWSPLLADISHFLHIHSFNGSWNTAASTVVLSYSLRYVKLDHQLEVCALSISRSPGFLLTRLHVLIPCHDQTWLLPRSEMNRSGYFCSSCTSRRRCCCSHPHTTPPECESGCSPANLSRHLSQYSLWPLQSPCSKHIMSYL